MDIFTDEKGQRIFNRADNTIVIKIVDETNLKTERVHLISRITKIDGIVVQ